MMPFATEFPVNVEFNRGAFLAETIAWLRGTSYCRLLDNSNDYELSGETAYLRAPNGEELRLRELKDASALEAVGFRYDFPDSDGRIWRTEAVVRRGNSEIPQDVIRLRTQCIAGQIGARLETPRKPYLVKSIVKEGWGGKDGCLDVTDRPFWLSRDGDSLEIAREITLGRASLHLPVVYLSATGTSKWIASQEDIEKLAYDLGGVAHVVAEPNRAFSFELRNLTQGQNVYGGSLGISVPGQDTLRRFYLGLRIQDRSELLQLVRAATISLRTQMPSFGWDWTELQEQALRRQRIRDRNRLTLQEQEDLFQEEIANLRDRIDQLEEQLASRPTEEIIDSETDDLLPSTVIRRVGMEIYPGEFSDRLRAATMFTYDNADQTGLDDRSRAVLRALLEKLPLSPALQELREDIKRATKDPKKVTASLSSLLGRHGYREKGDNKHITLEAQAGFDGLGPITLSKTPSDIRSLKNIRSQVERTLGLNKFRP